MKNMPNFIQVARLIEEKAPYNGRVYITIDEPNILIIFEFVNDVGYDLELDVLFAIKEVEAAILPPEQFLVEGFLMRLNYFIELMKENWK